MIYVLAGVNGAGKSSIGGSALQSRGQSWYNPDEFARAMHEQWPDRSLSEINSLVWYEGKRQLEEAIRNNTHFSFETTLGGNTITNTLLDAIAAGVDVSVWYCGLESVELHIQRVAARVKRGGHDIPENLIRSRYQTSMHNLCRLAPGLHQLAVYDNSHALNDCKLPRIRRLLNVNNGQILELDKCMPEWAKPVATVCLSQIKGA